MNQFYVYVLFDLFGVPRYIGKGKGRRWESHERHSLKCNNPRLRSMILEAQSRGLSLPKIKFREDLTEPEAFELEIILIQVIGRKDVGGPLFNFTRGGDGFVGARHTLETKAKISASLKGKLKTTEHARKAGEAGRGKKHVWTEEGRRRFVEAHTGKQWHLGHKHSPEAIAKIRAARERQTQRQRGMRNTLQV